MRYLSTLLIFIMLMVSLSLSVQAQTTVSSINEDFNSTPTGNTYPTGWNNPGVASGLNTTRWTIAAEGVASTNCAKVNQTSGKMGSAANIPLKSPTLLMPQSQDYTLTFKLKTSGTAGLQVYVSRDGGTTNDTLLTPSLLKSTADFTEQSISLVPFKGQTITLVFNANKGTGFTASGTVLLDDIFVGSAPTCKTPSGIYVNGTTRTSATLNWSVSGMGAVPDYFSVHVYDAAGNSVFTNDSVASSNMSCTVAGLTAGNQYTAWIRSDCDILSNVDFSDSVSINFVTLSLPAQAPYVNDFEGTSPLSGCVVKSATLNTSTTYAHNSTNSLQLDVTPGGDSYIVFPALNLAGNDVEVIYSIRRKVITSTSTLVIAGGTPGVGAMQYNVGYVTDPNDISTFVPIKQETLSGGIEWNNRRVNTRALGIATDSNVMVCIQVLQGVTSSLYLDDVTIRNIPSCIRPENITVTGTAADAISVEWDGTNAQSVAVRVTSTEGFDSTYMASQSPFRVTGLAPLTTYTLVAQGICSPTDSSELSEVVTATTLCAPAASPIFEETFDNLAANTAPQCWVMGWINKPAGVTIASPFNMNSTYKHQGAKSMSAVKMAEGTRSYLATQALTIDSANKYDVNLWVNRESTYASSTEALQLWVNDVPYDTTGGVHLGTINRHYLSAPQEEAAGWYEYSYTIPTAGVKYVIIYAESHNNAAIYFDDFSVDLTPSCRKVKKVEADTVAERSCRISWTAGATEQQWVVDYTIASGSTQVADTTVVTTIPALTISGLEPTTNYTLDATVRALCQVGDTSIGVPFNMTFTTLCEAIHQLPYTTSFETTDQATGTNTLPLCWTRFNDATSTTYNYYPFNYSSADKARSGVQSLQFYTLGTTVSGYTNAAATQMAILPEINTSVLPIDTLRLRFFARRLYTQTTYADAELIVGVMTDPAVATTFTAVDTVVVDQMTYKAYNVKFDQYTGSGRYVAIRMNRAGLTSFAVVDDVTLDYIPACEELESNVAVSNILDTSATLMLTETNSWSYGYKLAGASMTTLVTGDVNDTVVTITGLAPLTDYDMYVRRKCADGSYSAWGDAVSFRTTATPAAIPYACGFEDVAENGQWQYADGTGDNKLRIGTAYDAVHAGTSALYVTNDNGTNYAYSVTSASLSYAYRLVDLAASNYQIQYDWKATGGETAFDWGRVVLVPASATLTGGAGGNISNMQYPQGTIYIDPAGKDRLNITEGWNHVSQRIDMTKRHGRYNLVVVWNNNGGDGTQTPLAIDDISITEISCLSPDTIFYNAITTDSVTFTIAQSGVSQWEVALDTAHFTQDNVPAATLYRSVSNTNVVTISGLEANKVYYCTVRAICAAGDTSAWTIPEEIRTYCAAVAVPYAEDFEAENSDRCWSMVGGSVAGSLFSRTTSFHHAGLASIKVNGAVVSPEYAVDSLHQYMLNGWAYSQESNASFGVGVMVDPNDASTFEVINNINIPQANRWVEFNAVFTGLSDEEFADFSHAKHVVLSTGGNTIYFDDINIDITPTCPRPMQLEVTNVTANSFTLDFEDKAGASQWIVYLNGVPQTISTHPVTINGLAGATDYQVGVASICSANDTSSKALYGTVRTACDVATIPYYEGFERLDIGYDVSNPDMIEDICWRQRNASTDAYSTIPRYSAAVSTGCHTEGAYSLQMFGHTFTPLYLYMPEMPASSRAYRVMFDAKAESTDNSGITSFGYYANPADTAFTSLIDVPRSTTWTTYSVVIDSIPAGARLGFRYGICESVGARGYIDNVIINEVRTCSDPDMLKASDIVADEAHISFADTCAAHTSWQYVYGIKGFVPASVAPATITGKQFLLTGLQPETEYDFYVRAVCGTNDESNWIKGSFTTLCVPFAVTSATPYSDSFEDLSAGQILAGCYRVDGNTGDYYNVKGFVNTLNSGMEYRYARSGRMSLIFEQYLATVRDGQTAFRQFYLEAGHVYQAKVYVRSASYHDNMAYMLFGQKADIDSMQTLASEVLSICNGNVTYSEVEIHDYAECWQEMSNIITVPQSGNYFLALRADRGETGNNYVQVYFDDLSLVELTGCLPASVAVDSVDATNAYCHHNDLTPGAQYEYVVLHNGEIVAGPATVTSANFTVSNLSPSADYTLQLRHLCDGGNTSVWTKAEFSTECGAYSIFPLAESFEDKFLPACWTQFSTGTAVNAWTSNIVSIYCHDGNKSAYIANASAGTRTALVTKELNLTSPFGYYVRFWMYRNNDANGTNKVDEALHVLYNNAPVTATTIGNAHEIGMVNRHITQSPVETDGYGYYQYEFQIPAGVLGSTWVAFDYHNQYGGGIYLDDVVIEPIPSCIPPRKAGVVTSVTMTTANVEVEMNSNTQAQVAWALTSAPDNYVGSALTNDGHVVATGLAGNSNYVFRYRYVCAEGDTSAWSPAFVALTETSDCFKPQNLRTFGIVGCNHASITWGRAPLARNYQYILTAAGATVDSVVANVDTVVYANLTPGTNYTFRVRAFCSGDTTDWMSISFTTTAQTAAMPFICDFENTLQNAAWTLTNKNGGANFFVIGAGTFNTGTKSLYITNNGSSYGYTVTSESAATAEVLLELEAGNYSIDYDWYSKAENGSDYGRVFLMPESQPLGTFVSMDYNFSLPSAAICLDHGQHMSYVNEWQHYTNIIQVPADGVYRFYVIFSCTNGLGSGEPFTIDNINFQEVACMPVEALTMSSVRHDNATAVISKYDADAVVEYALIGYDNVDSVVTWLADSAYGSTATLQFANLTPRTEYYLFVRQACSATDRSRISSLSFKTPMPSVSAPYVCSFEANEPYLDSWTYSNGNAAGTAPSAKLVIGSTVHTAGSRSLFVSTDTVKYEYKTSAAGVVWDYAYLPIEFTPGAYSVTYDWNCYGDGTNDYGRLFLAPTSIDLTGGVQLENLTATTLPQGCIALDGGLQLTGTNGWTTSNAELSFVENADYHLVVLWHNDAANGALPPLAIDNIRIMNLTCPKFDVSEVTCVTTTSSLTVTVDNNNAGAGIDYVVSTSRNLADTLEHGNVPVGGTFFTVNGLQPSSKYFVGITSLCAAGDSSFTTVVEANTQCGIRTLYPYLESFENYTIGSAYRTQLADNCWLQPNATNTYSYFVGTQGSAFDGCKTLAIINGSGNGVNQVVALPAVDTLSGKRFSFAYKTLESGLGKLKMTSTLEFGYLATAGVSSSFVQVMTMPASKTSYTEHVYVFPDSVPVGATPAFRTTKTGTVYIDKVRLNNFVESEYYYDTVCYNGDYYMHGFACPTGSLLPGDTTLTRFQLSTTAGEPDSTIRVRLHVRNEIFSVIYDTVCQGDPYIGGYWRIANPQTRIYTYTWHGDSTASGCDSIVTLSLYVEPTRRDLYDTVCMGNTYTLHNQNFTTAGNYTVVGPGRYGCNDTVMLHLAVVDTLVESYATICNGDVYSFQGTGFSTAGTHDVHKPGTFGCTITHRLHLTVLPTDTFVTVSMCYGGHVTVADTTLTEAGLFNVVIPAANPGECDMTYHITATMDSITVQHVYDIACEGHNYSGYGINDLAVTADTVVYVSTRTIDVQCDSMSAVHLTFSPTQYGEETVEMPAEGYYEWHDNTYTQPGDYTDILHDINGCDSVVTLHLTAQTGLTEVSDVRLDIVPNPVNAGATAFVYGDYGDVVAVEILNSFGQVIDSFIPQSYPVEVSGITAAGLYYVRIVAEDGRVYLQKLIVR